MNRKIILRESRMWVKKLGFKRPINFRIYPENSYLYGCAQLKKGRYVISFYGIKRRDFEAVLFHELGHIKYNHCRFAGIDSKQEYQAEKFALKTLEKNDTEKFKERIMLLRRCIKDIFWRMQYPEHTIAIKKLLLEYRRPR
jgi:hypothetical protein